MSGTIYTLIGDIAMTIAVEREKSAFVDSTSGRTTLSCELVSLGLDSSDNRLPLFRRMLNGLRGICVTCNNERIDVSVRRSILCVSSLIMFDSGSYRIAMTQVSGIGLWWELSFFILSARRSLFWTVLHVSCTVAQVVFVLFYRRVRRMQALILFLATFVRLYALL